MNNDMNKILKEGGGGLTREAYEKAKQSGDATSLINSLSAKDKQKLSSILEDKEKLAEVLKSPQAQMLLKLFGNDKNG